jgi:aspartate/methionine/tyrosine aminotransferase
VVVRGVFSTIPYLAWIEGRPAAADHDLGSSDLRRSPRVRGEVVPPALADLPDPEEDVSLEAQLAAVYGVSESQVLVTAGATHANFLAEAAAVGRAASDAPQVLVEEPGYQPLVRTPAALGARVDRFERPADDGHALHSDRVAAAAADDFALAVVSNRHNPTGRLASRETLGAAARACADAGGHLLVDEVYASFVREADRSAGAGDSRRAFGGVTAAGLPNTLVTGSLTKFYGLGGVRIGWLVGPASLVARAREARFHVPAVADPSRALARRALFGRKRLTADAREHLARNHDLLSRFVAGRDDVSGRVHPGCSYALLSHEAASGDAVVEAAWDRGVLVVPGRFFQRPDAVRVSLGRPPAETAAALTAFGDVLDSLSTARVDE